MANNDILQYLRKTPHNTNVNVVKGMLENGSGSGAIEMETIFEDDIMLTYTIGQFGPPVGDYDDNFTIQATNGFFKLVYDNNDMLLGIIKEGAITSSYDCLTDYDILISASYYDKDFRFSISGKNESDEEKEKIQAYCQTPHHLKIEYFAV